MGTIIDFAGPNPPINFLPCNGTAVSRSTYAALFAVIGTAWGAGDGSTAFNLPNMQRRIGMGSGGTGTADAGAAVGATGGAETITLTAQHMPAQMARVNNGNCWHMQNYDNNIQR